MWKILEENVVTEKILQFLLKKSKLPFIGKIFYFFFYWKLEFLHELIYIFSSNINDVIIEINNAITEGKYTIDEESHL